jgi:CubicO group peptidase (beta-lactamase class C family)
MRARRGALLLALALATRALAQGPPAPAVDSQAGRWRTVTGETRDAGAADALVAWLLAEHRLRAISVAVVQDGRTAYSGVAGEVARGRPADATTVFRAASLSKPVFAYLVLRLVDEGVLGLDSPVADVLPRPLATYEHYRDLAADPRSRALTVRRILSQQSGLPNWHRRGPVPLLAEPGTRFGYSGEGYALLQLAIEERTGRTVADLAREKVFGPLGMANTSYLWEPRFDGRFAVDLQSELGPLIQLTRERAVVAGSLISNAADYARFLLAVLEGRGLSAATRDAMLAPQVRITSRSLFSQPGSDSGVARALGLSWTVGWGRMETARGPALFHVGREEGCEAYAVAFLEPRTAFVALSQSPLTSTYTGSLVEALIGGGSEPLDWLEYSRTVEQPSRGRSALAAMLVLLAGAAAVASVRVARVRR